MKVFIKIIIISSFLISCRSQYYIEKRIKQCVIGSLEEKYKYAGEEWELKFDENFEKIETFLLDKKYVDKIDKENYRKLLYRVIDAPEKFYSIIDFVEGAENNLNLDIVNNQSLVMIYCPYYVLITERNDPKSTLVIQKDLFEGLDRFGFENKTLVNQLIESTPDKDFKRIVYRVPLIYVLIKNIENHRFNDVNRTQ